MWSKSRERAAVDCREKDRGRRIEREEIMVGTAYEGKPGSHGSKAILLSHAWWVEPSPQTLSSHLNNREDDPSNA